LTAINLQTSFLHPPFGFALFFLRGVAPKSITTSDIYFGVVPFLLIQVVILALVWVEPRLVTAIPRAWNAPPAASTTPNSRRPNADIVVPEPPDYAAPDASPPYQR
jgi:hypothetical protein